jgi:poly(hydroxyalkanoate) granule-associated protein
MVKKLKALSKSDDKQLADAVRTSAQQIWQAGLGAFAKAQEEGGKVFAKLVKEGTALQKRTQQFAEDKVGDVTKTVSQVADNVSKQASGSWDKLEQVFEDRVSRSLTSLGVPTRQDIQSLTKRVEELNKAVAALSGKTPAATKKAAAAKPAKKAVKKAAVKKAPAKKAAAKPAAKKAPKLAVVKEAAQAAGK